MSNKTMCSNNSMSKASNNSMSNQSMPDQTMSNHAMSNKSGVEHRGSHSMSNRVSHSHRVSHSADHWVGNSMGHRDGSNTIVGHISNIAINIIGVVVDSLDAAVREVDRVGAINQTSAIIGLRLAEGSTRVLISNSIVVGVGGDLGQVRVGIAHSMGHRVSHSTDQRGMMGNHRVGNSMGHRVSHSADHRVSHSMSKANAMMSQGNTMPSQELGSSAGSSHQGREADESLKMFEV